MQPEYTVRWEALRQEWVLFLLILVRSGSRMAQSSGDTSGPVLNGSGQW